MAKDHLGEAISGAQRKVEMDPSADSCFRLACLLVEDRRLVEAETSFRKVIALEPNHAKALEAVGLRLQQRGQFVEAAEFLKRVIALDPERARPYHSIIRGQKVTEADRMLISRMEEMLGQQDRTDDDIRNLSYALGKAYEDLGDYGKAMSHFDEANKRAAQIELVRPYPKKERKDLIDQLIAGFTPSFLEADHGVARITERPILIVGMMRSGTTLAEQILSSHPAVAVGGEISFWTRPDIAQATADLCSQKIDQAALRIVAKLYLKEFASLGPDSPRVTDKMPLNFWMLGSIRILFPHAKVIHCRRNPVDTCLSLYTTSLHGADFLFDKGNIVCAYKDYLRLMAHWRSVLPTDFLFEVDYEALVEDREPHIRDMLGFLGLEWDDACLRHEENTREVQTPSRWQARQPIYKTSVERWRRYEPWLGEFREFI